MTVIAGQYWYDRLAQTVADIGNQQFFASLFAAIACGLRIERSQIWLYERHSPPQLVYHDIAEAITPLEIDLYLEGLYREDPFFEISLANPQAGVYRLSELIPEPMAQSGYYAKFYWQTSVIDELMILIPLEEGQILNICLTRSTDHPPFSSEEVDWLRVRSKTVIALVQQHVSQEQFLSTLLTENRIEQHINQTMARFASSEVTPREQEVLQLTLKGYSTAVAAERLQISVETLRRHRKNIYQKLDLSSQADLFTLFLNVLRHNSTEGDSDPLEEYLTVPGN